MSHKQTTKANLENNTQTILSVYTVIRRNLSHKVAPNDNLQWTRGYYNNTWCSKSKEGTLHMMAILSLALFHYASKWLTPYSLKLINTIRCYKRNTARNSNCFLYFATCFHLFHEKKEQTENKTKQKKLLLQSPLCLHSAPHNGQ